MDRMGVVVSECVANENNIGRMVNLEKWSSGGLKPRLVSYVADELSELRPVRFVDVFVPQTAFANVVLTILDLKGVDRCYRGVWLSPELPALHIILEIMHVITESMHIFLEIMDIFQKPSIFSQ